MVFLGACSEAPVKPESQRYLGSEEFIGFADLVLLISVLLLNYFFSYMNHILRGGWYRLSPTWRWLADIEELKVLSQTGETDELRQKCKTVLYGIYISSGLLFIGILFGFVL